MPNHVHMVFAPYLTEALARKLAGRAIQRRRAALNQFVPPDLEDEKVEVVLSSIMQSLKGWTARECNRALGRKGQFWQHESFDHIVRKPGEWERTVNYVVNNPVKAGLVEEWQQWKWSYHRPPTAEER